MALGSDSAFWRRPAAVLLAAALIALMAAPALASPAATVSGDAWAWGANVNGEGGVGAGGATRPFLDAPTRIGGLDRPTAIAAGGFHTLALGADGSVWAWGANAAGQLGPAATAAATSPVRVGGLAGATAIAAGGQHSLAVDAGGHVWAWGDNCHGQLGSGVPARCPVEQPHPAHPAPVQVPGLSGVVAVAAGSAHSLALLGDGSVWAWGDDCLGQLGDGRAIQACSRWAPPGGVPTPTRVAGLTGVVAIAAGSNHSLAVRRDGTVWAWGDDTYGQLGPDVSENLSARPVQIPGLSDVTAVTAGEGHNLALRRDGTVWTWGADFSGQLGNGAGGDSRAPARVDGLGGVTAIAAGAWHSLALEADGTVWSWGANEAGQLGDGSHAAAAQQRPTRVVGLHAVALAARDSHSLALDK